MDQESEETYDNNAASLEDNKTETDADTDKNGDAKSVPDCRLNGFVNKSFSDGGANSVDIPSIHVNDITEKHVNDVTDTQNDDVKVNMDDNKTHEEFEMGTHVTELNGKDYSHHNSLNDNNFTGQLNGSGSYTSLNDIDVPKYYSPRSRKGAQMGSENLITDNDLLLAATLVQEAMDGQRVKLKTEPRFVSNWAVGPNEDTKGCSFGSSITHQREVIRTITESYNYFKSAPFRGLLYLSLTVNLALVLFENPAVKSLGLPYWVTMTVEAVCLSYFVFRLCHHAHWRLWSSTKKDIRNIFALVLIVTDQSGHLSLEDVATVIDHMAPRGGRNKSFRTIIGMRVTPFTTWIHTFLLYVGRVTCIYNVRKIQRSLVVVIDMLCYALVTELTSVRAIRWTRPTRPFLLMIFADGTHVLRRAWSNIRRTLREIAHILIMFYFLIAVFSLVALKMFQQRYDIVFADGSPYFKDYYESFWQLYVLVTTCNNPDVMLPAYDKNRWYCLFFTVYIILCLYLMLNILLAVTYNSYRENMKKQIKHSAKEKKNTLNEAFEVIKINVDGNEMVTYKTWSRLLRLAHPGKTKHQIDLLMMVLDTDSTGYISRQQFLSVADLLNVSISEVGQRKTWLEAHCATFYTSRFSTLLKTAVDSIYFSLAFDGIVLANIIMICLNLDTVDWMFYALFSIEIFLKWYTFGTKRYFYRVQNWADVLITLLSLAILILKELDFDKQDKLSADTLSVFGVFRIFRIFRCLVHFERCRIMFDAVVNVAVSIFTYCCILFIVFYFFGVLGMELFAQEFAFLGYVSKPGVTNLTEAQNYCNNTLLKESLFATSRYCHMNFNDIINAIVVLSALLVGNNWQVIAEGFVLVTNKVSRIYFMCFHICITVVVMNIVTAFILDMFIYEYTFCKKGSIDTKVESTIKNLRLGIDDETGMEIGADENGNQRTKSRATTAFRRITTRRKTTGVSKPQLSRYDGIRFHIKKRGWTKTELLLQQLFELEEDASADETT